MKAADNGAHDRSQICGRSQSFRTSQQCGNQVNHSPTTIPGSIRRVAVVGAGISGLTAAFYLRRDNPNLAVVVLESSDRVGGILETVRRDGFLIERSADSFIENPANPWAGQLCDDLGFREQLIGTNPQHQRALVLRHGKLYAVPLGFELMAARRLKHIWHSSLLSWRGKLRLACERFVAPAPADAKESLAEFSRRRVGREAYERLVQPLVSGIYTADPNKLSVEDALPEFVEMERELGSLSAGLRRRAKQARTSQQASGARYQMFQTPRLGMSQLLECLTQALPPDCVRLRHRVHQVTRHNNTWMLNLESPAGESSETFDGVVLALPAHHASHIVAALDPELSAVLAEIPYSGVNVVITGYRRDQIEHPLDAFGAVIPLIERRPVTAVSFNSVKFPDRAPTGHVLLRSFVGGDAQRELIYATRDQLQEIVRHELAALLGARGEPVFWEFAQWRQTTPQYHLGHGQRRATIRERLSGWPGLELIGSAYEGTGIPACVRVAHAAVRRLLAKAHPASR